MRTGVLFYKLLKMNISKKKILKITTIVAFNKKIMYNDGVRSYNI